DRLEAGEGRTHADTGESLLRNRRIDHPFLAELVEQPLAHLIGALVLPNLLAHQEYVRVAAHLLGHGVAQSFAHGLGDHFRAGGKVDLRGHLARWRYCWRGQVGTAAHTIASRPCLGRKALAVSLLNVASSFWRTRYRRARILAVLKNNCDRRVHFHAFG